MVFNVEGFLRLRGPIVSFVGATPSFICYDGGDIVSVQWLLNGTLDDGLNMNVVSEFGQISRVGHLIICDVSMEYNGTTIQCRANSSSGSITCSNIITLLVQGWLYNQYIKVPYILYNSNHWHCVAEQ